MYLFDAIQPVSKIEWAIYTFIAKGCKKIAEQNLDGAEKIELKFITFDEFIDLAVNDKKFKVPVLKKPSLIPKNRSDLRYELMKEEVEEYLLGAKNGDLKNIAKELVDILYGVYGTILEHGLQDDIDEIFKEVHLSHMSKDYSKYKMLKGKNYFKPNMKKILTGV